MTSSQKPEAVTLKALRIMLGRRILPDELAALAESGYEEVRNTEEPDGKWPWRMGVRTRIFARRDLLLDQQIVAAKALSDSTQNKTPRSPGHAFKY